MLVVVVVAVSAMAWRRDVWDRSWNGWLIEWVWRLRVMGKIKEGKKDELIPFYTSFQDCGKNQKYKKK